MTVKKEASQVGGPQKFNPTRMASATPWILLAAILVLLGTRQIQAARERAEKETLAPITTMLGLSEDASKREIYARISSSMAGIAEVRKFRVARNVGLEPQWDQILERLNKLSPQNRDQAVQLIAADCDLPVTSTFEDIRRYMTLQASVKRSKKAFGCVPAPVNAL